jgi:hypothetical protein
MKNLQNLLNRIAEIKNLATSKSDAIAKNQDRYLSLDYGRYYGGYRVVNVKIESGAHFGAFGLSSSEPRKSNKEMQAYLLGYLNSLTDES